MLNWNISYPVSYSVATTRAWQDVTNPSSYRQMALGADNITIIPADRTGNPETIAEFTAVLRERKKASTNLGAIHAPGAMGSKMRVQDAADFWS